jgi:putative ABC transport system permease protein
VAVVNQQFVRSFLRHVDPIGQRMQMSVSVKDGDPHLVEIVGVVADMKQRSVAEAVPPTMYVPVTQMSDGGIRQTHVWFETHWVVRTRHAGIALAEALPHAMRAVDPLQPFSRIVPMGMLIDRSLTAQRFHMRLMGASAFLAVALAAAGLFGVISFTVAQRTHEMGVRLALGATAGQLIGTIVRQGMVLATIGVAIGVAGALALARMLKTFVFGVDVTDPATFIAAAALLLALAILASLLPAARVTRIDPVATLR